MWQLCTLEFETRRASYYWLLHALGLYQPHVWEYSRLNVSNTVMSKRKVSHLWDILTSFKSLIFSTMNEFLPYLTTTIYVAVKSTSD